MTQTRSFDLIAPSGYPLDPQSVHRATERLQAAGHRVENLAATQRRQERFAGTDEERIADINRLADPARPLADIVLAVRGGYGASRLVHALDYAGLQRRLRDRPVAIVGHSDFTAIQLALYARSGVKSFGGPMFCGDFGAAELSDFTMQHFWNALTQPEFTVTSTVAQAQCADATGMLWGGNLAMLAAMTGTPYMPQVEGGILFIEDVNEHPFRIERMLYQLHQAGILQRQQALVVGQFTGGRLSEFDNGYSFETMLQQMRSVIGIPVVTGLQFGHVPDLLTLPFGATAHLVAHPGGFSMRISDYPNLA